MYKVKVNNKKDLEVSGPSENRVVDQQEFVWDVIKVSDKYFHIIKDNHSYKAEVIKADYVTKQFSIKINGLKYEISIKDKFDILMQKLGFNNVLSTELQEIKAPMPGLILDIRVKEGDIVKKGDALLILEAMKMENVLKSPGEGEVKLIKVKKGSSVEKNQLLIQF